MIPVVVVDRRGSDTPPPPPHPRSRPTPADLTSGPAAPPPPQGRPIAPRGPGPSATLGSQICV